ncbi:1,4-alpha-glucan branching protein GlgB [Desulfitispora alkaliphila]|uniref:1,4-alpha-glucan branching protein GlgB n=1 Tax=Desulfitispora alkaliphila TaxID=622674 RepID=UPI003D23954C
MYLFHKGENFRSYEMLGAHIVNRDGEFGTSFALWAPNARAVSIVGDFNQWQPEEHKMERVNGEIWHIFIPDLGEGELYKYHIVTATGQVVYKADPYGYWAELRPKSASRTYQLGEYKWQDQEWQRQKQSWDSYSAPVNIYEVHLGSWKRNDRGEYLSYRELADELIPYVVEMGYTHVELLPVMEHPLDDSWGYQVTGYFAPTSRHGTPGDFMYFVDQCHQAGIGVILDWVPSHFCKDAHGLIQLDGTYLYEPDDPLRRDSAQWGTRNFDFGRTEVRSFLISNALYWLEVFHLDGLRVDAVASMLYLDYGREEGEWRPNQYGGRENIDAIQFLKRLNEAVFENCPWALVIAEESTAWPMVSGPTYAGGLGFNYKWNMGWMNDMLQYMEKDPVNRKWHHNLITFSFMYAFSENFVLPLSHDEVVHGKKSLLDKMPGDYWQKFANLRALYGYMMAHPGKKLLFMGGELGQFIEWRHYEELQWHLLEYPMHQKLKQYVRELNEFYLSENSLWEQDCHWEGFQWIDPNDYNQSVISFRRNDKSNNDFVVVLCNFTPVVRWEYRIGVPKLGRYREVFNSDWSQYGGSGQLSGAAIQAEEEPWHNQPYSIVVKAPPLATVYFKCEEERG